MDEAILVPAMFFLTVIILTLGIPLVRAFARRQERSAQHAPPLPHDLTQRLDRIEAMVETVAVEVERLAEGQRFTTRLLAEGAAAMPVVGAAQGERVMRHNGEG